MGDAVGSSIAADALMEPLRRHLEGSIVNPQTGTPVRPTEQREGGGWDP
jgi:hypothetical protein